MRISMRRTAALTAALALALSAVGCGGKSSSSGSTSATQSAVSPVSQYGGDMIKHWAKDGYEITVEVDGRFITEDESKALAKYIAAISRSDGKLMEESVEPAVLKYVMDANGFADAGAYASYLHNSLMQYTGEEYEFEYATVESLVDESSGYDFSKYDKIILDAEPDAEITSRKKISADALYDHTNKSLNVHMGGYIEVYLYTVNGVSYILS